MTPDEERDIVIADLQRELGRKIIAQFEMSYPLMKVAGAKEGGALLAALTIFDVGAQIARNSVHDNPAAFRAFLHTRLDFVLAGKSVMQMGPEQHFGPPRLVTENDP